MTIKIHDVEQGTDEWLALRCGILTASEMKHIITPAKLDPAKTNHVYDILAQRITGFVEPSFQSYDMERGNYEEPLARGLYAEKYAPVLECGFITNEKWGFTIGYSPDGLVGDDGCIEIKSQNAELHTATVCTGIISPAFLLQIQTGLMVSERKWCDFISYSGGMEMYVKRVYADADVHKKILAAAMDFEGKVAKAQLDYQANTVGMHPTERTVIMREGDIV